MSVLSNNPHYLSVVKGCSFPFDHICLTPFLSKLLVQLALTLLAPCPLDHQAFIAANNKMLINLNIQSVLSLYIQRVQSLL